MFPLFTKTLPGSADELAEKLNDSLQRVFFLPAQPVTIRAAKYPVLEELVVSLDGAQLRPNPPQPILAQTDNGPALRVEQFTMSGRGIEIEGAAVDLSINATGVRLNVGAAPDGDVVLLLHNAADGRVQVTAGKRDLEALISQVAKREAAKQGVTVDDVHLNLEQRGARSLSAEVQLRARKLFVSASIRITAQLDIDEQLNALLSGLRCDGNGAIASFACGILAPHLQRLNGRRFSLMALPLGQVRLRDVRLAVGNEISVSADFAGT
jgi:hypothetical protein